MSSPAKAGLARFASAVWASALIIAGSLIAIGAQAADKDVAIGVNRNLLFLPVWVAKERGLYAKHGINASLRESGGGVEQRTALLSGALDFIVQSPEGSGPLYEQGQRLVNVVATQGKLTWMLVLSNRHKAIRPGDVAALKSMKLGVTNRGSGTDMQLQALLRRGGLTPDKDVNVVAAGGFPPAIAAMDHGQLDGLMVLEPATTKVLDGSGFIFMNFATGDAYPGSEQVPMGSLAATAEYLAKNEATAKAVVEAIVDAMIFISKDPAWTAEYVAGMSGLTVPQARKVVDNELVRNSPVITEAGWNTLMKVLIEGGLIKKAAPYDEVVAKQFLPVWNRYAAEVR